jgi:transposase-like protein
LLAHVIVLNVRHPIDSTGATIDFLLSALRDADTAKRLFRKALSDLSHPQPRVINTDPASIYSSAIPDSKQGRCAIVVDTAPCST